MRRVSAKFVPRLLTEDQKNHRVQVCRDLLQHAETDCTFLSNIITGDESWVFGYDPETKQQSSQWKHPSSPRPKKARQVRSNQKAMLIAFFDHEGIVHHEFAATGQTINQHFYLDVLKRLRDAVRRKRPAKWQANSWLLQHDNAPAHTAVSVRQFLAKNNTTVLDHPPYSPDLAPCDFFLFPKLKSSLKGARFESVKSITENSTNQLKAIASEDYSECFEKLKRRWQKCIAVEGDYFEGDTFD